MKHSFSAIVLLILITLVLGGCAFELPLTTPEPVMLATAGPAAGTALPTVAEPQNEPALASTPAATIVPAATPEPLPAHPTITETLDAGLAYVQAGFRLDLPSADSFIPTQPPDLNSVEIEQALASGDWLVAISPVGVDEGGQGYRTVIISNDSGKEAMRWWGQVDERGLASTTVFTGMPRPKSTKANGMIGKIVPLPDGSAYPRYFENEKGQRFGVASNKEGISALLENMTEADGRIQVWGEVRYAVNDYNGRRILVRKYDLKDAEPETILARAQKAAPESTPAAATDAPETDIDLGPIAILYEPKPRAILHGQARASGEVINPTGDQVIVRVEDAAGQTLGETTSPLTPPQDDASQFTAVIPFTDPPSLSNGRIAIYAPDDASGRPLLLGWQEVRFAGDVGNKRVTILQPESGATIRGKIQVAGRAENIPSNSLLVRVEDTAGTVMGKSRAKINAKGAWRASIQFRRPKTARQGVIAVYDVNPDDGSLILLAQIPVWLKR